MAMASSDPIFVSSVAQALVTKVEALQTGRELVDVAQTAAKLRRAMERLIEQNSSEETTATTDSNPINDDDAESGEKEKADDPPSEELAMEHNVTTARNAILESTSQLLTKVSELAIENVGSLTASELRELLLLYSSLPFRADSLVDTIEEETARRLKVLGFKGPTESVQDLARRAFDSSVLASNTLSEDSDSASTVNTIKNGIKAIFGVHEISKEASEEDLAMLRALAENTQQTTTLVRETLGRMEQIRQGTGTDTETLLRGAEQGAAIELGRCQELIAVYRRNDFSTGEPMGRYDSARRRGISKRILSRLFP